MSEWSFQRKLITGVIAICLLAILTSGATLFASRTLIANMATGSAGEGRAVAEAKALQLVGVKKIADVQACLLTGGREFAPAAREGSFRVRELAQRLRSRITDPAGGALLDGVLAAERAHQEAFNRVLAVPDPPGGRSMAASIGPVPSLGEEFDHALAGLVTHVESLRLQSFVASLAAASRAETLLVVITIATIMLLVLLCLLLIAALNRSYRLQTAARTVAEHGQTEAKATLSEVEAASHMKDEFLATVSHELRNPLAPIVTWTQLLRSGTLSQEKSRRALEIIESSVTSQVQLIDDLIDVSRVVSGKFRLDVRPVDLLPVIKAAADSLGPASDAKQIRLQLVLDERAGTISGDSERLQQVMWNLISNAIKFTPKGGRVKVVLERAESHVEIAVSDSGIGITPEFLPHVFEPFRQGTGGSTRRHGGLGLGLSIVRHIVELHGGEISAHSAGQNLGSTFTITFPLLATDRQAGDPVNRHPIAGEAGGNGHLGRLDGVRVLIVEDEVRASEALQVLFASCGAEARVANSAAEGFAALESWLPDVLVSDIAMPGEDGYSLIRRIRQRSPEQGGLVPAVALTAYAKIGDRVTILGAGFQMYLSKPANPSELIAVVGSLAKRVGLDHTRSATLD